MLEGQISTKGDLPQYLIMKSYRHGLLPPFSNSGSPCLDRDWCRRLLLPVHVALQLGQLNGCCAWIYFLYHDALHR